MYAQTVFDTLEPLQEGVVDMELWARNGKGKYVRGSGQKFGDAGDLVARKVGGGDEMEAGSSFCVVGEDGVGGASGSAVSGVAVGGGDDGVGRASGSAVSGVAVGGGDDRVGAKGSGRGTRRRQKNKKKELTVKQVAKHYRSVKCPLCNKETVHIARHLRLMHVLRDERIPAVRVPSLVQIAKHGNKTRASAVIMTSSGGAKKVYQRKKEICPLCETVTHYLTTHLHRVHKLKKKGFQVCRRSQ